MKKQFFNPEMKIKRFAAINMAGELSNNIEAANALTNGTGGVTVNVENVTTVNSSELTWGV